MYAMQSALLFLRRRRSDVSIPDVLEVSISQVDVLQVSIEELRGGSAAKALMPRRVLVDVRLGPEGARGLMRAKRSSRYRHCVGRGNHDTTTWLLLSCFPYV